MGNLDRELLEYQPDAAAIEAGGVPGGARWVLYVILAAIVALVSFLLAAPIRLLPLLSAPGPAAC